MSLDRRGAQSIRLLPLAILRKLFHALRRGTKALDFIPKKYAGRTATFRSRFSAGNTWG
jgi:hypothetical protein